MERRSSFSQENPVLRLVSIVGKYKKASHAGERFSCLIASPFFSPISVITIRSMPWLELF